MLKRSNTWPTVESGPGIFLAQVRLDRRSVGEPWRGRLIEVFLAFDAEQSVRSYASPSRAAYVPIQPPNDPVDCVPLRHIRLPKCQETEEATSWSVQLLEDVPQIREMLTPFSKDVEGLLSQILCPEVYGYSLTEADEAE